MMLFMHMNCTNYLHHQLIHSYAALFVVLEQENKLFVGMTSRNADEDSIRELFSPFGAIREIYIIRNADGSNKGCAFLKYADNESALNAIETLNDKFTMEGATRPLIVKFADTKAQRKARTSANARLMSAHQRIEQPGIHAGPQTGYYIGPGPHVPVYPNYQVRLESYLTILYILAFMCSQFSEIVGVSSRPHHQWQCPHSTHSLLTLGLTLKVLPHHPLVICTSNTHTHKHLHTDIHHLLVLSGLVSHMQTGPLSLPQQLHTMDPLVVTEVPHPLILSIISSPVAA